MSALRPTARLAVTASAAATRSATRSATTTTKTASSRLFSTTQRRAGGGMQYDPPTGWLWGVRPGEKYQNEGWENIFYFGFCGSLGVFAIAYAFKPDTSIQTWALEEARRRLEVEGILEDPHPENKPK